MTHRSKTVCFVAGKSGGHIIPCITLAQQEKNNNSTTRIIFLSSTASLDHTILNQHTALFTAIHTLSCGNSVYRWYQLPLLLWHLVTSFFNSIVYLHTYKPDIIISTGGVIAIPVCFAAFLLRIPIELYELNAVPGKTITFIAPLATKINVCFRATQHYFSPSKCYYKSYPVRFDYTAKIITTIAARTALSLDQTRTTLFIVGGSQGSVFLNTMIQQWLDHNRPIHNHLQIIHQTGKHTQSDWKNIYMQLHIPAYIFSFNPELAPCYAAADVVICRAGAGILFETIFFEKPCITIPLQTATTSHQIDNAHALAQEYPQLIRVLNQQEVMRNISTLTHHISTQIPTLFR